MTFAGRVFAADTSPAPKPELHPAVLTPGAMETSPGGWIDLLADKTLSHWKRVAYAGNLFGKTSVNGEIAKFNINDHAVQMGRPPGEWQMTNTE